MNAKQRNLILTALGASLLIGMSGCVQPVVQRPAPAVIYVQQPPPREVFEIQPPPPNGSPYWVWQKGHWRWEYNHYQWHPGHWVQRPPRYTEWVAPQWHPGNGGWVFVEGRWR